MYICFMSDAMAIFKRRLFPVYLCLVYIVQQEKKIIQRSSHRKDMIITIGDLTKNFHMYLGLSAYVVRLFSRIMQHYGQSCRN